jgi:hypothetical protein
MGVGANMDASTNGTRIKEGFTGISRILTRVPIKIITRKGVTVSIIRVNGLHSKFLFCTDLDVSEDHIISGDP